MSTYIIWYAPKVKFLVVVGAWVGGGVGVWVCTGLCLAWFQGLGGVHAGLPGAVCLCLGLCLGVIPRGLCAQYKVKLGTHLRCED